MELAITWIGSIDSCGLSTQVGPRRCRGVLMGYRSVSESVTRASSLVPQSQVPRSTKRRNLRNLKNKFI